MHTSTPSPSPRPFTPRPVCVALLAALPLLAQAQTATPAQTAASATWLDTVTVVGTRTALPVRDNPASVSVVDQDQIERQAPESIAEMLRDVPGVEVVDSNAAGMKRLSIRGESSRRVTILVDGQEMTDHSTYGTPVLVDPANVERIEVVRGPSSVLYGAKAIGGVVNIVTRGGAARPIQLETGVSYDTAARGRQGWAALSGTLGAFDYRLSGQTSDYADRRVPESRYAADGRLHDTAYGSDNGSLHLGYTFGQRRNHVVALKAERNTLQTDSWTDPATLTYPITDFRIDLPRRERRKVGLFYDGTGLSDVVRKVHVDAYYQTVDREFSNLVTMRPTTATTVGVTSTSDDRIRNYGGTAQVDLALHADHTTIAGLHYLMDDLDTAKTSTQTVTMSMLPRPVSTVTASRDRAESRTASAFVQDSWRFAPAFSLSAGVRYYEVESELKSTTDATRAGQGSQTNRHAVKSLGLTYAGLPATTLRMQYAEGYTTPTLLQRYTDTSAGRGTTTYGNPDLAPETSRNLEAGARYNRDGLVLDGAVFHSRARNYITDQPCTTTSCPSRASAGGYTYVNADQARAHGLELAAEYLLPGTSFTPYVNATWTRRQLRSAGLSTYDSGTPAVAGRAGVRHDARLGGHEIWSDLYLRAATGVKQTTLESGTAVTRELPGWATLNLGLGTKFGRDGAYQASLNLLNLFNKAYRASLEELPGAERSVVVTLRATF
ncbi:MAG: TonB-dependent receptor [Candidatus Dactylopiibacterium sp.]|nr:TonB-dependent receptor [Candidatus Dactylopiibacterium sp.]